MQHLHELADWLTVYTCVSLNLNQATMQSDGTVDYVYTANTATVSLISAITNIIQMRNVKLFILRFFIIFFPTSNTLNLSGVWKRASQISKHIFSRLCYRTYEVSVYVRRPHTLNKKEVDAIAAGARQDNNLHLICKSEQICSVNTKLYFIFIFDLNYDWEVEKSITEPKRECYVPASLYGSDFNLFFG